MTEPACSSVSEAPAQSSVPVAKLSGSAHVSVTPVGLGEYAASACLLPSKTLGITDPIVVHSRLRYYYEDGKIKQSNVVNFRIASLKTQSS